MGKYYNVNFEVKYNKIKEELLNKLKNGETNLSDEEKYSEEDVETICQKLYLDEYSSAFYSKDFLDSKIDVGSRKVFKLLMKNEQFEMYINKLTILYTCNQLASEGQHINEMNDETYDELKNELDENMKYFSFLSLFDVKLFYLTHQFICHYIKNNEIEQNLFQQIKELNVSFLRRS